MQPSDICICGQYRSVHVQGFGATISGSCSSFRLASHAPGVEPPRPRTVPLERGPDETCGACRSRYVAGGVCPKGCPAPDRGPQVGVALEDSVPLGDGNHLVRVALGGRAVDEGCGLPQTERRGDWMQTYTGRQYWPLDPRPDDVCMEDIGHHLSMLCRYCGACLRFYSVAEHSVGVLHVVTEYLRRQTLAQLFDPLQIPRVRRHALLHDAPEAYCHDLIRPIKRCVTGYAEVEAANADAIALRFGLGLVGHQARDIIKAADNAMLLAEQAVLMLPAPAKWSPVDVPEDMLADAAAFLEANGEGWTPGRAKVEFLAAWEALPA